MNPFTVQQKITLTQLRRALPERKVVLIGAAALGCCIEMTWRQTNDLDLTVVAEPCELESRLRDLSWDRDPRMEQRWTSQSGIRVDVLPASPSLVAAGEIIWAESGHVMNLSGFDLALTHCTQVVLEPGLSLDVAILPAIVVLKMTAWLDRPQERDRDLEDLSNVFDTYLADDDMRRWEDELIEASINFEDQSAFALGQDIGRIVSQVHVTEIARFLDRVSDESRDSFSHFARHFRAADKGETLRSRLAAFRAGLGTRVS